MSTPFYDLASLVIQPSGVKAQKVYAQKPMTTDGQLTFSRASTATRVGPDGLIQKVRTNLLLQSNSFDTGWSLTSGSSVTSGQSGYDGSSDAWLLNDSGNSSAYCIYRSYTNTGVETFSIYAKQASTSQIEFDFFGGSNGYLRVNLTDGSLHSTINTIDYNIEDAGSGWWRCSFSANNTSAPTLVRIGCDGAGTIYIQDAQIETGDIATDYIPTTTAAVSVGLVANLPRIDYTGGGCGKLLLEPQRTNLALYSEQLNNAGWSAVRATATANAATSPDGFLSADKLIPTSVVQTHLFSQSFTSPAAGTYAYSAFFKKGEYDFGAVRITTDTDTKRFGAVVNLTNGVITATNSFGSPTNTSSKVEDYGNGWYRLIVTCQHTSGNITVASTLSPTAVPTFVVSLPQFAGDDTSGVFTWGAQLEAGAYATSYIPTLGAAVTRLADSASKTGIASLIGQSEGTLFVDFTIGRTPSSTDRVAILNDGTGNERIGISLGATGLLYMFVVDGGATQAEIIRTGTTAGTYKVAAAYKANDFVFYVNGVQVGTDTAGTIPSCSRLDVGNQLNDGILGGGVSQALLFKTRLTNAQLAELTAL